MPNAGLDPELYLVFREQLRRFVRDRLVPAEPDIVAQGDIPPELLEEMRAMGLFGLTIPEEYGGSGFNISQYIETIRELCWAMPAFRSVISINIGMMGSALVNSGTQEQRARWLPKLAAGMISAFALTEPDSGSDSAALRTRAVRHEGGYILDGVKRYITNAPRADVILVLARTSVAPLPKNSHISAFVVPRETPGVSIGKPDRKMGQAGSEIADVILENVHLPADSLLGAKEGTGFQTAMKSIDNGRLSVAAASCGYAKRILDSGLRYARERRAFGEPIASFQLVQAMLADSQADIYAAECMISDACAKADQGQNVSLEASCAKMFASEMCGRVADRVVQIYGGAGYVADYEAERFYRDVRIFRIYEGTTQIQQLVIAKRMLREAAHSAG